MPKAINSAAQGAATGATLGSVVPGIGTAVGGIVGGVGGLLGGLFGGDDDTEYKPPVLLPTVSGDQINAAYDNTQDAIQQQQALVNAVNAANGVGNQTQVYNQLQGIAAGTGPNPALAQLANATGQNVSQQAALLGSQRGASANPGMIARLAAQQGGQIQQQAVGQAAALQAQQQLNAINMAGGLANSQAAQQLQAAQALNAAAQGQQSNLLSAGSNYNAALTSGASEANKVNNSMAQFQQGREDKQLGGILNAAGTVAGMVGKSSDDTSGGGSTGAAPGASGVSRGPNVMMKAYGGEISVGAGLQAGGKVPGQAKVPGDDTANDTVHALLSPQEIVLPRSVTLAKNAPEEAAKFVAAVLKQKAGRK